MCCSGCISSNFPCHTSSQSSILCLPGSAPPWETSYRQHPFPEALEEQASSGPYMPLCSQNSLAGASGRKHGDLTVWALAFPSGHREGSLPKQPEDASRRYLWDPTRGALAHLHFPSHITFSVAFVTCHTYHILLEVVSFTGFQGTHFYLIP